MDVAILLPLDSVFSGYHHAAGAAPEEAAEGLRVVGFPVGLAAFSQ